MSPLVLAGNFASAPGFREKLGEKSLDEVPICACHLFEFSFSPFPGWIRHVHPDMAHWKCDWPSSASNQFEITLWVRVSIEDPKWWARDFGGN